jgi:hypothetical protein
MSQFVHRTILVRNMLQELGCPNRGLEICNLVNSLCSLRIPSCRRYLSNEFHIRLTIVVGFNTMHDVFQRLFMHDSILALCE